MDERFEYMESIKKEWRQVQSAKLKGLAPFIQHTDCTRTPGSFFSAHRRSRELLRNAEQCTLASAQSFGAKTPSSKPFDAISGTAVKLCVKIPSMGQDVTNIRTEERLSTPSGVLNLLWSRADRTVSRIITSQAL
jgi:hypothetical protein